MAVIPARSGSKGLPGKNIKELCGKPLLAWTIEAALESSCFDKVLVSTDSLEYGAHCKSMGGRSRLPRSTTGNLLCNHFHGIGRLAAKQSLPVEIINPSSTHITFTDVFSDC